MNGKKEEDKRQMDRKMDRKKEGRIILYMNEFITFCAIHFFTLANEKHSHWKQSTVGPVQILPLLQLNIFCQKFDIV